MKGSANPVSLRRLLLGWYRRNRRALPWRKSKDPYRIWVSEVMLQQTTVKAVVPHYEAFLERYPTLASLAGASEDAVLGLWSGLGYYHRARNLLRGARHVVAHHAGRFPKSLEAALAVPGVGLYTGSAILSIAYGVPLPVVDGNVRRVLARLEALSGAGWKSDGPYYNRAEILLDREHPGDWNQALMELGASLCTPKKPACPACPVRSHCQALARGLVDRLPEARRKRAPVDVTVATAVIERNGRILLVRRPSGRLLGRMWEIPQTSLESRGYPDLVSELKERHGLDVAPGGLVARTRHAITFRRIRVESYEARLRSRVPADADRYFWAEPQELETLATSSLTRKVLRAVASAQLPLALEETR